MNTALSSHGHENILEQLLEGVFSSILPPQWAEFFTHFIGDTISILFILFIVMFAVSLLQTYIPFEKLKGRLSALGGVLGYALALLLGVFSPFCSCTIVPVVMGIISVGVPVPVALCYLSSASLLNGGTLIAVFSSFGTRFGAIYTVLALLGAVITALIITPLCGKENILSYSTGHLHGGHPHSHTHECDDDACMRHKPTGRIMYALENVGHIFRQTVIYMLLSVMLASALISFVPAQALGGLLGQGNVFSPLLAGAIAAPIHADIFSALPLLRLLVPINPAAALAFVFAGLGISVPEAVLLSRVFKTKTVAAYAGAITAFALIAGYGVLFASQFMTVL